MCCIPLSVARDGGTARRVELESFASALIPLPQEARVFGDHGVYWVWVLFLISGVGPF